MNTSITPNITSHTPSLVYLNLFLVYFFPAFQLTHKGCKFPSNYTSNWTPGPTLSCFLWVWIWSLLFSLCRCAHCTSLTGTETPLLSQLLCYSALDQPSPEPCCFSCHHPPPISAPFTPFSVHTEQMMTNRLSSSFPQGMDNSELILNKINGSVHSSCDNYNIRLHHSKCHPDDCLLQSTKGILKNTRNQTTVTQLTSIL